MFKFDFPNVQFGRIFPLKDVDEIDEIKNIVLYVLSFNVPECLVHVVSAEHTVDAR